MAITTGLKFRAGIEELDAAKSKSANATRQFGIDRERVAAVSEEQRRYNTSQIVNGLKGIGDAIDNEELKKQKKEAHAMNMKSSEETMRIQNEELDLKKRNTAADEQRTAADIATKKADMDLKTNAAKREEEALAAADKGVVGAYGKRLPKGMKDKPVSEQAAWLRADAKKRGEDTNAYLASLDAKNKKLDADAQEIANTAAFEKMMKDGQAASTIASLATNPGMVAVRDLDKLPDAQKKVAEKKAVEFEKVEKKIDAAASMVARATRVASLGGVKLNANGEASPEEIKKWKETGFSGVLNRIKGDPNHLQIKAEMIGSIIDFAKTGTVGAVNLPGEVKRATQYGGGDITNSDINMETLENEISEWMNGPGVAEAYFATQAARINGIRTEVLDDFKAEDGFQYVDPDKKNAVLSQLLPSSYRTPGEKDYAAYGANPGKVDPQEMANLAFGIDPVTGEPNFKVPAHYAEDHKIRRLLDDPVQVARLKEQANVTKPDYAWTGDNAKRAEAWKERNDAGKAVAAAPGAQRIPEGEKPAAGGVGPAFDPVNGNPTTVTFYDPMRNKHFPVSASSLVPAAGATPASPDALAEHKKGVGLKYNLDPNYDVTVRGAYGVDAAGYEPGTATAAP
jgi:hypothetical protein